MAAYDRVLVEITDHVGTATLNRPEKANAFDPDMCEDLLEALRMLASADAVRVIVVTGAGATSSRGSRASRRHSSWSGAPAWSRRRKRPSSASSIAWSRPRP